MGYYTNDQERARIDRILKFNAAIQANLHMKTELDLGSRESSQRLWIQLLIDIRDIDEEFYMSLASNEEKRLVDQKIYSKPISEGDEEPAV